MIRRKNLFRSSYVPRRTNVRWKELLTPTLYGCLEFHLYTEGSAQASQQQWQQQQRTMRHDNRPCVWSAPLCENEKCHFVAGEHYVIYNNILLS